MGAMRGEKASPLRWLRSRSPSSRTRSAAQLGPRTAWTRREPVKPCPRCGWGERPAPGNSLRRPGAQCSPAAGPTMVAARPQLGRNGPVCSMGGGDGGPEITTMAARRRGRSRLRPPSRGALRRPAGSAIKGTAARAADHRSLPVASNAAADEPKPPNESILEAPLERGAGTPHSPARPPARPEFPARSTLRPAETGGSPILGPGPTQGPAAEAPSGFAPAPSPDLDAASAALRAADCSPTATLTAREREACLARAAAGGRRDAPLPPPDAWARRRRGDEAHRQGPRNLLAANCGHPDGCAPEGMRFGRIPPASPVIPPSTLRGDDDALRPKPKP
jgi:hypothetical protein